MRGIGGYSLKVLDCTLRDGGYVNNWHFPQRQILKIINTLEESNVEIIELGYLDDKNGKGKDSTLFSSVALVDKILNKSSNTKKVMMINLFDYDVDKLPQQESTKIEGIRLAFHKKDIDSALQVAEKIIALGYQLFFQPMVTKIYSNDEFLSLINKANKLDIYAFYVVDSFGSMTLSEFKNYIYLADRHLNNDISLGYHSHNNMQLAFSNAVDLCNIDITREVIIDSSIYGMGRGAGNLNTELITDYLNTQKHKEYNIVPLLKVIDEILVYYYKKYTWGFSPAQYLSASFNCHPNYASYLVNKKTSHIADISRILEKIPPEKSVSFDREFIENLYQKFLLTNKSTPRGEINIALNKKVLLIASGSSINENLALITNKIESQDYFVIALNHKPPFDCDYYFFSNQQRFDEFKDLMPLQKQVITSNIEHESEIDTVIDLKDIAYTKGKFVANVAILMINYLILKNIKEVEIVGLDGYQAGKNNYAYDETSIVIDEDMLNELNKVVQDALYRLNGFINIELCTPSVYADSISLKVMGVIPARFDSSRFQGKPLCLINNVPMIKRTYDRAKKSKLLDKLVIATDSQKIKNYCEQENIPVVMTSKKHLTGTDRLAEVAQKEVFDFYINIQGDEPVIDYQSIDQIVNDYKENRNTYDIYNLYKKIDNLAEVESQTIIKTVVDKNDNLMYMSRHPITFNQSMNGAIYNKQVCVYGFTKAALNVFSKRKKTHNEQFEDIELLRFLDLGCKVKMSETVFDSIAVDVPSDVKKVENFLNKSNLP